MLDTYKNLKPLANLYCKEKNSELVDIKILAHEYQNSSDECEKGLIVSYAFCRVYRLMYAICSRFYYLNWEDKASFALEEITKVLKNYNPKFNTRLTTVITKYLYVRLRMETEALSYHKQRVNNEAVEYNSMTEIYQSITEMGFSDVEFMATLETCGQLSSNELKYCQVLIGGDFKVRDCDIAKELGMTSAGINYLKKSLYYKLPDIIGTSMPI